MKEYERHHAFVLSLGKRHLVLGRRNISKKSLFERIKEFCIDQHPENNELHSFVREDEK